MIASKSSEIGDIMGALRVHQWIKNLLVFVPIVCAHQFWRFDQLGRVRRWRFLRFAPPRPGSMYSTTFWIAMPTACILIRNSGRWLLAQSQFRLLVRWRSAPSQ